jgi:tetratricopeptide (TPR) repeat protein
MRRFAGRHRLAVAASAAAVIALSIGLATTVWQYRLAETERARAERRFDDVRRLASTVIFDLHDAIEPLPGSTDARRTLIQRALTYVDGLAAEAADDVPLQRELVAAYERLAKVQGRPGNANLGDRDGARGSLDKAIATMQRIADNPRATVDDRVTLARLYNQRGGLDADNAIQLKRIADGLALLDSLNEGDRRQRQALSVRASLLFADGAARANTKSYDAAKAKYGQAVDIFQQLFDGSDSATRADSSRNLSIAEKSYGSVLWVLNNRSEAIDHYRKAEALDRQRVAAEPQNTTWQLDLSYSLSSLAFAEIRSDRPGDGLRHYQQSLEIREGVLKVDPVNDQAQDAVARAHETLAQAYQRTGDRERALASGIKGLELRERRLASRPKDPDLRNQVIGSLATVYDIRLEMAQAASNQRSREQWQHARSTIGRIAHLQDEAAGAGATPSGPDRASLLSEIAKCDAAIARLSHAP